MNRKHPLILLLQAILAFSFAPVAYDKVESVHDGDTIFLNSGEMALNC
jgi:hypothetical protein